MCAEVSQQLHPLHDWAVHTKLSRPSSGGMTSKGLLEVQHPWSQASWQAARLPSLAARRQPPYQALRWNSRLPGLGRSSGSRAATHRRNRLLKPYPGAQNHADISVQLAAVSVPSLEKVPGAHAPGCVVATGRRGAQSTLVTSVIKMSLRCPARNHVIAVRLPAALRWLAASNRLRATAMLVKRGFKYLERSLIAADWQA